MAKIGLFSWNSDLYGTKNEYKTIMAKNGHFSWNSDL